MSKEEQIDKLCNDLNKIFDEEYRERRIITAYHTAKGLYEQGYRKQSEVVREIFEEIRREIKAALKSNYNAKQERVEKQIPDDFVSYMCEGKIAALRGIDDFIDELEQKYTEGDHE